MTREQQIAYVMSKNPSMSRAQAIYYIEQVLGMGVSD